MASQHWAEVGESTFVGGTWLLYGVHRAFGRWPFLLCLYPVVLAYWLGSPLARRSSLEYLRRLHAAEPGLFDRRPGWRASLRHFTFFAETLLDKMLAIGGRIPRERVRFSGYEPMLAASRAGEGGIIVTAHMGCLELMQVAATWREGLRVSILVHTANAQRFNQILDRINPKASVRLLQVTDFSPATAMMLADRVAAGEFIAIAGDRVPVAGDRLARADFLGHRAELPAGPYLMAAVLRCPVWLLSCQHEGEGYHARIELMTPRVNLARHDRQAGLDEHASRFAAWMTARLRESPYDWFNFYPFWEPSPHGKRPD
ncbi:acyltransferase [Arenimonas sp.]|uniref:LpxL/LpxP family acyltransferase n=1 Tax=Arenimonas sp. TaxID=1872635 RepID=UPI0035B102D6